jgi:hypothetical protein
MLGGVGLARVACMFHGVSSVTRRRMRMVGGLFSVARLVMGGGFLVVGGGLFVMFGGLFVMLCRGMAGHDGVPRWLSRLLSAGQGN